MGFLRGFSIAMGANAIVFVLSFLNNKLIYVFLSPEDNGSYFLVMRTAMFVALLFGEWVRLSNVNIAGESRELSKHLITNELVYVGIVFLALFGIGAVLPAGVPAAIGLRHSDIAIVLIVGLLLILKSSSQSLLLVNNRMLTYGATGPVWMGMMLVMNIVLVIVLGYGLPGVLTTLIVSGIVAAIWALGGSIRYFGIALKPSLSLFRRSGAFGTRAVIAVTGTFVMLNIHTFLIRPLAFDSTQGILMVGIFSVCFRIYTLFQRVSDVSGSILFSHVAQQKDISSSRLTAVVNRNLLFIFTIGALFMLLFGKYLIYIVADTRYSDAYIPLICMLPGIVIYSVALVINSSYWGRGYPYHVILSPFVVAVGAAVLDVILIPHWGVTGAAVSFSAMSVAWYAYLLIVFHHQYAVPFRTLLLPHVSDFVLYHERILRVLKR